MAAKGGWSTYMDTVTRVKSTVCYFKCNNVIYFSASHLVVLNDYSKFRCLWDKSRWSWYSKARGAVVDTTIFVYMLSLYNVDSPSELSCPVAESSWHRIVNCQLANWPVSVPCTCTETAKRVFCVVAPNVWNSLPNNICNGSSLSTFRAKLKTYFFYSCVLMIPSVPLYWHLVDIIGMI